MSYAGVLSLLENEGRKEKIATRQDDYTTTKQGENMGIIDPTKTMENETGDIYAKGTVTEISGRQAENYKRVLESLGYSANLDKFHVDSRGYSPELGSEFGEDYLDNRVIIASEKQLKTLSLAQEEDPNYIIKIIAGIPVGIVKSMNPYDALTGYVNLQYGSQSLLNAFDDDFKDEFSEQKGLHACLSLDTLEGSEKKICAVQKKISKISAENLKDIDKGLIEEILTEMHPLTSKYGSLEQINSGDTHISIPSEDIERIFSFRHKNNNISIFNCQTPFLIYTGEMNIKDNKYVKIMHVSEKDIILNYMVQNQLLEVQKETVAAMMELIAKDVLNKQKQGTEKLNGFQFYKQFNALKESDEVSDNLKAAGWHLLRDFYFDKIEFTGLPLELKEKVVAEKRYESENDPKENDSSRKNLHPCPYIFQDKAIKQKADNKQKFRNPLSHRFTSQQNCGALREFKNS